MGWRGRWGGGSEPPTFSRPVEMTRAVKYGRGQVAGAATRRRDRHPPRYFSRLSFFRIDRSKRTNELIRKNESREKGSSIFGRE